jgi:hypothetical protein
LLEVTEHHELALQVMQSYSIEQMALGMMNATSPALLITLCSGKEKKNIHEAKTGQGRVWGVAIALLHYCDAATAVEPE